jgi:RimJ/RimL family protein N-acetyltransferase
MVVVNVRPLVESDLEFLNKVRNQNALEFLHDSRTFTLLQTTEWFTKTKPDYYLILVENLPAGYFRITNHSVVNKNLYIGADLAEEYQGKGLAYQAYSYFLPYLFEEYTLNKITLEVLSTNRRAINLYYKLGFITEGVKRQEVLKGTEYVDSIIMSILKNEYNGNILENK